MELTSLILRDFRNFEELHIQPSPGVNIVFGDNAQGKTNLLEAIYYLSVISSFRSAKDRELVRIGADAATLDAGIYTDNRNHTMSIAIPAAGRRSIQVNRVNVRKTDAAGRLKCVLFCPEDLDLIRGSAAGRRRFLDDAISQLWPMYIGLTSEYNRLLQHKTRILRDYHENPSLLDTLDDFSTQLCVVGAQIIPYRERFCQLLNREAAREHDSISRGKEVFHLDYHTVSTVPEPGLSTKRLYECLAEHYTAHRAAEIASGSCLTGPHKDDFTVSINDLPARQYASQGQTRTAVLSLKLAQREIYHQVTGEYPVLLFDDVLSELDHDRQQYVLYGIDRGQVFITTCDYAACQELLEQTHLHVRARLFHVKQGAIDTSYQIAADETFHVKQ